MSKEAIEKLCAFGLSPNEAKVYWSLISCGWTGAKDISAATGIHPQDVYKILNKLENKELILKTFNRPLQVEIIPIEKSLNQLILSLKHKTEQKINSLETYLNQIKEIARKKENDVEGKKGTYVYILEKAGMAKLDETFENIQIEYDLVVPDGPFEWVEYLEKQFKKLTRRGATIRILILTKNNENYLANEMKNIQPPTGDYEVRTLQNENVFFVIIDFKEAWFPIMLENKLEVMITNAEELVEIAKAHFERLWNSPKAKIITSQQISEIQYPS